MNKEIPEGYNPVSIPTSNGFVKQYNRWIYQRVSVHFKRNKDRIPDVAQDAIVRLLSKDFIGRWFFKHLSDDLVDRAQAERIYGKSLSGSRTCSPIYGSSRDPNSLWKIRDVLSACDFDYNSYYYSPQNHTIPTSKVLELLGESNVSILESLYRQGRLLPSGFTEHDHDHENKLKCSICLHEKQKLLRSGLSLNMRWSDNPEAAMQLRWNDSQLSSLLRSYKGRNSISGIPMHIMRPAGQMSVDAGLLKYASMIISNCVYNTFKSMGRRQDLEMYADSTSTSEDNPMDIETIQNKSSIPPSGAFDPIPGFSDAETYYDLSRLMEISGLSDDESTAVMMIDGPPSSHSPSQLSKLRNSAISKMRNSIIS